MNLSGKKLVKSQQGSGTGADGDQTEATPDMGKMFTGAKISFAVKQIQQLTTAAKGP